MEEQNGDQPDQPQDGPVVVALVDEESQANFDAQHIGQTLAEIRQLMAAAKVNRALAQRGLLSTPPGKSAQDLHPEKFTAAIERHRAAINVLVELETRMGPQGLPETTLAIAGIGDLTGEQSSP